MAISLLDITDSNLQLWHNGTALRSPGYALLHGQSYTFGNNARSSARLKPRDINTRFWWQLNTEPLRPAMGPARHTADMVHSHLLDIHQQAGQPEEILLAVSGSMQRDQLSLLLGIIQQCPFTAVGLVNRAVALASLEATTGQLFHLEIQLHQAVLSELESDGTSVELKATTPLPGCGLLQLQERLVETIASAFIRQTRFDPRRKADTEQLLYDKLPDTLRSLKVSAEVNVEINGYSARVNGNDLQGAGQRLFDAVDHCVAQHGNASKIIADPLGALLPGLQQRFGQIEILPNDALLRAIQQQGDRLVQRDEALNFMSSLPLLKRRETALEPQPIEPAPLAMSTPAIHPTHVLQNGVASALPSTGLSLSPDCLLLDNANQWLLQGQGTSACQVNDSAYSGQALQAGDTIRCGNGAHYTLIQVVT
jgi:hypothetical protein